MEAKPKAKGTVTIVHRGQTRRVRADIWQLTLDKLTAELGPWEPGASSVTFQPDDEPVPPKPLSTLAHQVSDDDAETRISAQHTALRTSGVDVDTSQQLFATGTRMAQSGYATQAARKREHEAMCPLREVTRDLVETVCKEKRANRVVTAKNFAGGLVMNGKLTWQGYSLREQAIRGLLLRLQSPAAGYVFGVRDRMREDSTAGMRDLDRAAIVETLQRECLRNPGKKLNLRMRDGLADIFAIVSPSYGEADAPSVLPAVEQAFAKFGDGLRATSSYDPATTAWEIRAQVHTPTRTEEQAVGEPFQGYVSICSKDNGTGRLNGGGGILIIACLNASVYVAAQSHASRVHRGRVLWDLDELVTSAARNISALCDAWGIARADVLDTPTDEQGKLIPIEDVIPGYYRDMLSRRRGELVGVLPGRTAQHVTALAMTYGEERRDKTHVTRADLAQGFTRYVQTQPLPVQHEAESAIAAWLVGREPVRYVEA